MQRIISHKIFTPFFETPLISNHLDTLIRRYPEIITALWTDTVIILYFIRKNSLLADVTLTKQSVRDFRLPVIPTQRRIILLVFLNIFFSFIDSSSLSLSINSISVSPDANLGCPISSY